MCACTRASEFMSIPGHTALCSEGCSLGWNRLRDVVAEQAGVASLVPKLPELAVCSSAPPSVWHRFQNHQPLQQMLAMPPGLTDTPCFEIAGE